MNKPDGGPAFPVHEQWSEWSELKADYVPRTGPRGGMSLRDYFAAQIAAAIVSRGYLSEEDEAYAAVKSYRVADAMLAERAK